MSYTKLRIAHQLCPVIKPARCPTTKLVCVTYFLGGFQASAVKVFLLSTAAAPLTALRGVYFRIRVWPLLTVTP